MQKSINFDLNLWNPFNLRLDSAIFCLVTTSHEGGIATRSAPVWLVSRAFALELYFFNEFLVSYPYITIILLKLWDCLFSLEHEVSMVTARAFTPRSLEKKGVVICGTFKKLIDLTSNFIKFIQKNYSLLLVTWKVLAMLSGFVFAGSPPSKHQVYGCSG